MSALSFIPQVIKVLRTGKTDDLALGTFICTTLALAMWCAYGIWTGTIPVAVANGTTATLASIILITKLRNDLRERHARSPFRGIRWSFRSVQRHRARFAAMHERPAACWFPDPAHDWVHGETP